MKPRYPLQVHSLGEPPEVVATEEDLVTTLEWFDSSLGDTSVRVTDALGRPVILRIEAMVVKVCEVAEE